MGTLGTQRRQDRLVGEIHVHHGFFVNVGEGAPPLFVAADITGGESLGLAVLENLNELLADVLVGDGRM